MSTLTALATNGGSGIVVLVVIGTVSDTVMGMVLVVLLRVMVGIPVPTMLAMYEEKEGFKHILTVVGGREVVVSAMLG